MAGKVKKIIGAVLAVLAVLMIILLCIFLFWLGPAVKLVAEQIGSKALGTPLTISELKINPRDGTFHMSGFNIANPEGFGRTNAVSLANMDIAIDVGSIFSPTVMVHKVQIDSPYFIYEQSAASDNLTQFMNTLEENLGNDAKKPKKAGTAEPKAVIVEQLEINDIQFHLANTDATNLDIDVGIEQITASMTNGTVVLKNLHVGNPALLATPNLLTLDGMKIEVDPASIYSHKISIRDVQVIRPYAYLEHNPQTDTVAEFMKIAKRFSSTTTTNTPPEAAIDLPGNTKPEEPVAGPPPVELHHLMVDDIQIKLLDTSTTHATAEPIMLAGIGSISVKLVDGRILIKGISVPNPAGYPSTNLFHLGSIEVSVEPDSLFAGRIEVEEIRIDSPEVHLEQTETGGNIAGLHAMLMGFAPAASPSVEAPSPAEEPVEVPEPIPLDQQPVVLHSLVVSNFTITLSQPISTNEPSGWAVDFADLGRLNPLANVSFGSLNPLAKDAPDDTPEGGPLKLVYFDLLTLQPLDGVLQIDGLGVANPPGYANKNLAKLDRFRLEIDPDTLQSDVLLIRDILIDTPRIAYERRITTNNLKAMQAEIEKAMGKAEETTEAEPTSVSGKSASETSGGQKVIIEHLLVKNGLAKAKLSMAPSLPIPLPDIEMHDLGKETGGTSFIGAITEIGTTLYDTIIGSVSGATGFAGDALKGVGSLTLGTLGIDGENTAPSDHAIHTEEPLPQEAIENPALPMNKKPRTGGRRLPGRSF